MGQQQILLIVLSVILVGIAIAVGITMFQAQAKQGNIDAIISDLNNLGSVAYQYKIRPVTMGGGGGYYDTTETGAAGFDEYFEELPAGMISNSNATYDVPEHEDEYVIIVGVSKTQKAEDPEDVVNTGGWLERYILVGPDGILSIYNTLAAAQTAAAAIGGE